MNNINNSQFLTSKLHLASPINYLNLVIMLLELYDSTDQLQYLNWNLMILLIISNSLFAIVRVFLIIYPESQQQKLIENIVKFNWLNITLVVILINFTMTGAESTSQQQKNNKLLLLFLHIETAFADYFNSNYKHPMTFSITISVLTIINNLAQQKTTQQTALIFGLYNLSLILAWKFNDHLKTVLLRKFQFYYEDRAVENQIGEIKLESEQSRIILEEHNIKIELKSEKVQDNPKPMNLNIQFDVIKEFYRSFISNSNTGVMIFQDSGEIVFQNKRINQHLNLANSEQNEAVIQRLIQILVNEKSSQSAQEREFEIRNNKKFQDLKENSSDKNDSTKSGDEDLLVKTFANVDTLDVSFRKKQLSSKIIQKILEQTKLETMLDDLLMLLKIETENIINNDPPEEGFDTLSSQSYKQTFCKVENENQNNKKTQEKYSFVINFEKKLIRIRFYLWEVECNSEKQQQLLIIKVDNLTKISLQLTNMRNLNLMSHHLKTPLNCSIGMLQLTKNKIDVAIYDRYIKKALNSNYILLNNLNCFLDLEHIEFGSGLQYQIEEFDLKDLMREIEDIFSDQLQLKEIQLIFQYNLQNSKLFSDRKRIVQCFINLISNSIKFSNPHSQIKVSFLELGKNNTNTTVLYQQQLDSCEDFKSNFNIDCSDFQKNLNNSQIQFFNLNKQENLFNIDPSNQGFKGNTLIISDRNIQISIRDYGEGMNQNQLQMIMNRIDHNSNQKSNKHQKSRQLGFGLQSSIKILSGLTPEKYHQTPVQIKTNPKQGCQISFKLRDFSSTKQDPALTNQINLKEKTIISMKSGSFFNDIQLVQQKENTIQCDQSNLGHEKSSIDSSQSFEQSSENVSESGDEGSISYPIEPISQRLFASKSVKIYENSSKAHQCFLSPVLIVDDIEFNIFSLKFMFEDFGIDTDHVYNGQQAIDIVKRRFHDRCANCSQEYMLILMDIDMPIQNGFEASKEISMFANENGLKINLIACTANFSSNDVDIASKSGMNDFITKPVLPGILQEILNQYVQKQDKNTNV